MEFTIILIIVVAILLAYLIFKFVKKLVFAIIGVSVLFALIVLSVFGLVYLDVKQLSEQQEMDLELVYEDNQSNYVTGAEVMLQNGTFDLNSVRVLDVSSNYDPESLTKDDGVIAVIVSSEALFNLLRGQDLDLTESFSLEDYPVDEIKVSREELLSIIESDNAQDQLISLIFDKMNVPEPLRFQFEDQVLSQLNLYLEQNDLTIESLLFVYGLGTVLSDQTNMIDLIEEYKEGRVEVYPNRITFRLVKLLPLGLVSSLIPVEEE